MSLASSSSAHLTPGPERPESLERARAVQRFADLLRAGRRVTPALDSQEAFAKHLRVSRRTLQRMENGDTSVSLEAWLRAWQALGILKPLSAAVAPTDALAVASAKAVSELSARRPGASPSVSGAPVVFPTPAPRPPKIG